jgi:tungstate transport system permease protein
MGIKIFTQIDIEHLIAEANDFSHRSKLGKLCAFAPFCHPLARIKPMLITFQDAFALLAHLDAGVMGIVLVSLQVSFTALFFGTLLGLPIGALLATEEFRGKKSITITLNTLMGVPTVIVGVVVYLLLSRSGPLGVWGWLFTIKGMVIAQTLLTTPLIAALSRQILEDSWRVHRDSFKALRLPRLSSLKWLMWDNCRISRPSQSNF